MATTDAKTGFRLPWTADRSDADARPDAGVIEAAPDEAWAAEKAAAAEGAAARNVPSVDAQQPVSRSTPRKPSKFLADLTRAMQAAAEHAREQTLSQFQADAKAFVELIHETSAADATTIRTHADEDIAGIREWSKAEIARIREETEHRITGRKAELEHQLEAHAAGIESRIERVHATVTSFESEMATFFERLLTEDDPSAFGSMAENLPEPPRFEDVLPEAFLAEAADNVPGAATSGAVEHGREASPTPEDAAHSEAVVQPAGNVDEPRDRVDPVDAAAATGMPEWPAADTGVDQPASPETAGDDRAEGSAARVELQAHEDVDLDAAEAEAALAARAESLPIDPDGEQDRAGGARFVERLAGLAGTQSPGVATVTASTSTQIVVVGLVSVASIASFKRQLGRVPGVESVGVSSGPDGEFVFAVTHAADVLIADTIATLPGFGAQVTGSGDGVVHVTAHDPEAGA